VLRLAVGDAAAATTWELAVEAGVGRCEPTTRTPELRIGLDALAAVYLGGTAPSRLARAGTIDGEPAAVARADRIFGWPVAPWCPETF
jgi:predicted acetyltransferase